MLILVWPPNTGNAPEAPRNGKPGVVGRSLRRVWPARPGNWSSSFSPRSVPASGRASSAARFLASVHPPVPFPVPLLGRTAHLCSCPPAFASKASRWTSRLRPQWAQSPHLWGFLWSEQLRVVFSPPRDPCSFVSAPSALAFCHSGTA